MVGGAFQPDTIHWHKYRQASAAKGMMGASAPEGVRLSGCEVAGLGI